MPIFFVVRDRGTLTGHHPFTPEVACERLHKAFKGFGTDDSVVIEIFTKHNYEQRMEIKKLYEEKYGKELIKVIKKELGGSYEDVAVALFTDPEEFIVQNIHDAVKGFGTDKDSLIGLLIGRSNQEMEAIREAYSNKYGKGLGEVLDDELSGDFKKLMLTAVLAQRDEDDDIELLKAEADARRLHVGGVKLGEEAVFEKILTTRSYPHLKATFKAFKRVADKDIKEAIKDEFSGDLEDGLCAMVDCIDSESGFYAKRLHKAFKGMGTDDQKIIRIIVLRSEIDMQDIKEEYESNYGKSLADSIQNETKGDYRKMLLALIE